MKRIFAHLLANWQIWSAGALAAVVLLAGYTALIDHRAYVRGKGDGETKTVTRIIRVTGKETVRRVEVVRTVKADEKKLLAKIDKQATAIAALMAESRRLSIAYDSAPCLMPDAVARLAAVGWGK